jgi:phage terminase small subunit
MGEKPLTPKQQRFVAEYLIDLNATQAAIRAGYSEKTAEQIGYQLLQKTSVAATIAKGQEKRAGKLELTAEKVLADIEATRLAAAGAEQYASALRASELQGKHLGMFIERRETTVKDVRLAARLPEKAASDEAWAAEVAVH